MANADTFNVTAAGVQRRANPGFRPGRVHLTARTSSTFTAVDATTVTDSTQSWEINALVGLFVVSGGVKRKITANTATTITPQGGTSGWSAPDAYTVQADRLLWSSSELTTEIAQAVGRITSMLPEKYRQLTHRVEGEIVVPYATEGQTDIVLTFAPTSTTASNIRVWRNPDLWPDPAAGTELTLGASGDYEVDAGPGNGLTLHLGGVSGAGLNLGDKLVASYDHDMLTDASTVVVPPLLTYFAETRMAYHASTVLFGESQTEFPENVRDSWQDVIAQIEKMHSTETPAGIPQFDKIRLMIETREAEVPPGHYYGSMAPQR